MVAALTCLVSAASPVAHAQPVVGTTDLGGVLGVGNVAGAPISIGGRFETIVRTLPEMGGGTLGIQGSVDVYTWRNSAFTYRALPIAVTANYHAPLTSKRVDAFGGLGLGYTRWTCDTRTSSLSLCGYDSGLTLLARVGGRYYFQPNAAFYGELSTLGATLNLGAVFKLK